MTGAKKNIILFTCLLMIISLIIGGIGHGSPASGKQKAASGAATTSSMSADVTGLDFLEVGSSSGAVRIFQEPFWLQYARSGLFIVMAVMAVFLTCILICLKLFQTANLLFDFNRITAYIHDQDGMK